MSASDWDHVLTNATLAGCVAGAVPDDPGEAAAVAMAGSRIAWVGPARLSRFY